MADIDPNQALEDASKAYLAHDYQSALDLWTSALDAVESEHHYALHTNRGAALERLGRVEDAIKAYDDALQSKPDHVEALHNRGVALKAQRRYSEALSSFDKAIEHNPDFYPSWRGKTDVLTLLERFDEAVEAASEAHRLRPTEAGPLADRAFAYLKGKKLEESLADYLQTLQLGDDSQETKKLYAITLSQRAVELDKSGVLDKAEEYYSKAIEIEPTESRLFNRAFLYMRTGRIEDAISGYRHVITMSATNFQARAALGTLLLQREHFAEAIPVLAEAQKINPGAADIAYNLGYAKLKTDEIDEAEELFQTALKIEPTMDNAKSGLEAVAALRAANEPAKYKLEVGAPIEVAAPPPPAPTPAPAPASVQAPPAAPTPAAKPAASPAVTAAAAVKSVTPAGSTSSSPAPKPSVPGSAVPARTGATGVTSSVVRVGLKPTGAPSVAESPSKVYAVDEDGVSGLIYAYDQLKAPGPYPDGIDLAHREAYMTVEEFTAVLGVGKPEFYAYPKWKRTQLRKQVGLF